MRAPLKEITERRLDALFRGLVSGELHQSELPLAVEQFYHLGLMQGMAYAQQLTREYEHKLDGLYLAAFSPKDRREEYQRRLDEHFKLQEAAFFAADVEDTNDGNPGAGAHSLAHESVNYQERAA